MVKIALRKKIYLLIVITLFFLFVTLFFTDWRWNKIEMELEDFSTVELLDEEQKDERKLDTSDLFPPGFSKEKRQEFFEDINGNGKEEVLITSINDNNESCLVVAIINENNEFEKIGEFIYKEAFRGSLSVVETRDINNNGKKEIILSLASGGVSTSAYGIFSVDFINKEINWVEMETKSGETVKALFYVGSALAHYHNYKLEDLDKDGQKEIMTIDFWLEQEEPSELEKGEILLLEENDFENTWWRCKVTIYKWDEDKFFYNEELLSEISELELREICAF